MKKLSTITIFVLFVVFYFIIYSQKVFAAGNTYYVSPTGDNSSAGTSIAPWATFVYAFGHMTGGDTLILKDGVYAQRMQNMPSGTASQYTVIKAEHDGQAVVDGSYITTQYQYLVDVTSKNYVQIEGLAIRNNALDVLLMVYDSSYIKILRTSAVNKMNYAGSNIFIGGNSHHVLLEDVWVTGSGRYGVIILKPTAYLDRAPHEIILRRVVTRHDYRRKDDLPTGDQIYPICGIQVYGEQNGDAGAALTRDVLVENSLALDLNYGEDYYQMSGGICEVARSTNISYLGNLSLNIKGKGNPCLGGGWGCTYPSQFSGFVAADSRLNDGGDFTFRDNVSWDTSGPGFFFGGSSYNSGRGINIDQNTVGPVVGTEGGGPVAVVDNYSSLDALVTNNLFYQTGNANTPLLSGFGTYSESFNWYYPASLVTSGALNPITTAPAIQYITQTPDVGTGEGGVKRGATILYKYGVDGTLWGDPGYNQLTNNSLWPWPYEDQIKSAFRETNNPQTNSYPPTNNTKRGFAADGSGLYGGPITLTSYIWEYLGNPCPADICTGGTLPPPDTTPPSAPVGIVVQ